MARTKQFMMIFLLLSSSLLSFGQKEEMTRILFILDASQSMSTNWQGSSKMVGAKKILSEIVDSLGEVENVEMALRVYGHQFHHTLNNCKDTRLMVGFSSRQSNHILIKSRLGEIQPKGITPIAYTLEQGGNDFPEEGNSRNIIIIITDGEESCQGDPCEVSESLQKKQVILKPFVIGLGDMVEVKSNLSCVGSFYEAKSPEGFKHILSGILRQVLDKTSAQVNLLDESGHPTETDVNMTFYNAVSLVAQYNYYHTLNVNGIPDTIDVDPINRYNLIIHTLPPIIHKNVNIEPNKHNVIEINAAQGDLRIQMGNNAVNSYTSDTKCYVRKSGTYETVNIHNLNETERYLTGSYDLEILTLPRIYINNVDVDQSKTTTIKIPEPGLATIYSSVKIYGGIFIMEDGQFRKIYQLNDRILKETIALQPGRYVIIYRNKLTRDTESTHTKSFEIGSGKSIKIKL